MDRNVVECIILNDRNEVLLQKKTLDYPSTRGAWGIFGGEIENNEKPKEAVVREIFEETGITINPKFYGSKNYNLGDKYKGNIKIYTASINDISKISLKEGAGFALIDKTELNDIKINNVDLETLINFYEKNGN